MNDGPMMGYSAVGLVPPGAEKKVLCFLKSRAGVPTVMTSLLKGYPLL